MKKVLFLVIIIILAVFGFFAYQYFTEEKGIPILETEENKVSISSYHIYGTHLNMNGSLNIDDSNFESIYLTLYNGEFIDVEINHVDDGNILTFNLSDDVNDGLYLDDIARGKYYMFIKAVYENPDDEEKKIEKYYILNNETEYAETEYYTFTNINNRIDINSINDYSTMMLDVKEKTDDKKVADIVIDPGHGGMDGGAEAFGKCERDYTYNLSVLMKEKLEAEGYSVVLTRDELDSNTLLDEYNAGGRAVIPSEVYAKYVFSVHFNSNTISSVNGLEIYSPANINYEFAKSLAENVATMTGLSYSNQKTYKLYNGIYMRSFSESEIISSLEGYNKKGYVPYNITTKSNYYYIIRETGGIVTGAYVDDSNLEKVGQNPYYNSNRGSESYVLELGYITNSGDFAIIESKHEEFADALLMSVKENMLK